MFFMIALIKSKQECQSKTKCPADSASTPERRTVHEVISDAKATLADLVTMFRFSWYWTWKLSPAWNILLVPVAIYVGFVSIVNFPATTLVAIFSTAFGIVYSWATLAWVVWFHLSTFFRVWRVIKRFLENSEQ